MSEQHDQVGTEWGNFFIVPNVIITEYGPKLGVYGIAIYSILAEYASHERKCFPAVPTIAGIAGCSENKVRDTIKHLVTLGLVKVEERQRDNGGQTSNLYTLLKPPPSCGEAPPLHVVNPNKTHIEQDPPKEDSSLPVPAKSGEVVTHRKRDLLFEMVCKEVFAFEYKPEKAKDIPKSLKGWINGVTADLKAIECTPQELKACMEAWDQSHTDDPNFSRPQAREKVVKEVLAYRAGKRPQVKLPGTIAKTHNKDIIEATPEQIAGVGVPMTPEKMEEIRREYERKQRESKTPRIVNQ